MFCFCYESPLRARYFTPFSNDFWFPSHTVMDMQYFQYFLFLYFLQSLMEFNDFLYVQVSITLHYFLFELGFIHTFYIIFPQYLVSDICLCKTEYFCLSFSNYSQTSIEIFSYISIQSLFLYTYSKSRSPCLAIDRYYTSKSLYTRLSPIRQS